LRGVASTHLTVKILRKIQPLLSATQRLVYNRMRERFASWPHPDGQQLIRLRLNLSFLESAGSSLAHCSVGLRTYA
jgi:hypothetical protein